MKRTNIKIATKMSVAHRAPEVSISTSFTDGPLPSEKFCRNSSAVAKSVLAGTEQRSRGTDTDTFWVSFTARKQTRSAQNSAPRTANSVKCAALRIKCSDIGVPNPKNSVILLTVLNILPLSSPDSTPFLSELLQINAIQRTVIIKGIEMRSIFIKVERPFDIKISLNFIKAIAFLCEMW